MTSKLGIRPASARRWLLAPAAVVLAAVLTTTATDKARAADTQSQSKTDDQLEQRFEALQNRLEALERELAERDRWSGRQLTFLGRSDYDSDRARRVFSSDAMELYALGNRAMRNDDFIAAQTHFEKLISRYPGTQSAWRARHRLLEIYQQEAGVVRAERDLERVEAWVARLGEPGKPRHHGDAAFPGLEVDDGGFFDLTATEPPVDETNKQVVAAAPVGTDGDFAGDEWQSRVGEGAGFKAEVGDRIFFADGTADIDPRARQLLGKQAAWIRKRTPYRVRIEGHADDDGSEDYNHDLALARAEAVHDVLVEEGVASDRLELVVHGRVHRVAVCDLEICTRQNRRVVTVIEMTKALARQERDGGPNRAGRDTAPLHFADGHRDRAPAWQRGFPTRR